MKFNPDSFPSAPPVPGKKIKNTKKAKQEEASVLDETTEKRVRDWSQDWLQNFYTHIQHISDEYGGREFGFSKDFSQDLARIVGVVPRDNEGRFQLKYSKAVAVFIDTMINFVKNESLNSSNSQKIVKLNRFIKEKLFSMSPNIFSAMILEDQVLYNAKANRVYELQGYIGQNFTSELAYNLAWGGSGVAEYLGPKLSELNIADKLDVLDQLQTTASVALAEQPESVGENGIEIVKVIAKYLGDDSASPFLSYKTKLILERFQKEMDLPSVGVISFLGEAGQKSRLSEHMRKELLLEHNNLRLQINPDKILDKGSRFIRISSDTVGVFDHSNKLRQFFVLRQTEVQEPQNLSLVALNHLIDGLEHQHYPHPIDLENIIEYLSKEKGPFPKDLGSVLVDEWRNLAQLRRYRVDDDRQVSLQRMIGSIEKKEDLKVGEFIEGDYTLALKSFFIELRKKVEDKYTKVYIRDVEELLNDVTLNPFTDALEEKNLDLLIQQLHDPSLSFRVEQDLGIKFSEIPLRSQIHFLRFLSDQDAEGFNRLRTVLQKHSDISNKILNSFLACAEDVDYSESILTIAENFDTDTAQAIYDKYLEISSASEQIRDFIYHQTNITGITDNQIQKITQKLLHRANEILKSFAKKSSPAEDTPAERERVLKDLEVIKDEAWLITSTFSTLRDGGVAVEFKDIVNMNPEIVTGLELARNPKDVEKMLEIFYDNYHKYPAEFRDAIIDGFRQKLAFDNTDFYILRYKGEIVSFFRFDRRFEMDGMFKDFYFGSVNTDTGFTGGRFAEVMFSEALKARAKEGVIEADCDPETEVSSKYIEQGFVATKYYEYKGVPSLGLILDQELNSRLRAKTLSREEIDSLESSPELFVSRYNRGEKVDFSKLSQGYILSRYIKTKDSIICVFEKI